MILKRMTINAPTALIKIPHPFGISLSFIS